MAKAAHFIEPSFAVAARPLESLLTTTGVTPADMAVLRESDLAFGVRDRAEAALMLRVDAAGGLFNCEAWTGFLVASLTDYLIWDTQPCSVLSEADARWLCTQIGESPTQARLLLMTTLLHEAGTVPHWFGAVVRALTSHMPAEAHKAPALRAA